MLNLKPDPDRPNSGEVQSNTTMTTEQVIVRVDQTAGEGLDELFKAVISGDPGLQARVPHQLPMRKRNLPPSFFQPPSAASSTNSVNHSRESSLDGGYQSGQIGGGTTSDATAITNKMVNGNVGVMGYTPNGLAIIHPRANSSPAALQPANMNGLTANNGAQAFASNELKNGVGGGGGADDGRSGTGLGRAPNGTHYRQMSFDLNMVAMPDGWEMSKTQQGEPYFLNHKSKTTTWEDPRKLIVQEIMRNSNSGSLHSLGGGVEATMAQQQQQQQQAPIIQPSPGHQQQLSLDHQDSLQYDLPSLPLPKGWEQTATVNGHVYFINHVDQTTSWFHPAVPQHVQMKRIQAQQQQHLSSAPPPFAQLAVVSSTSPPTPTANIPPELVVALKNMNCQTPPHHSGPTNQNLRDLELERERMRQRQEELLHNNLLNANVMLSSSTLANPDGQQQAATGAPTAPASVFHPRNDCHSRQESADSAIGDVNTTYSMPHTPDDFLRTNGGPTGPNQANLAALPPDDSFDNMHMGLDLEESMDFMQLDMNMDLLSNVEELLDSNKDSLMTWL